MTSETGAPLGRSLGLGKEAEVSPAGKRRAFREAMNLAVAESLGLPVPAAWCVRQIGGRWALVMDRVDGPSFAELLQSQPEVMPECIEQMATLHLQVHACRPVGLTNM